MTTLTTYEKAILDRHIGELCRNGSIVYYVTIDGVHREGPKDHLRWLLVNTGMVPEVSEPRDQQDWAERHHP